MTLPDTLTALPDTDVFTTMPDANHRPDRLDKVEETSETGIVPPDATSTMPVKDTTLPDNRDRAPVTDTRSPDTLVVTTLPDAKARADDTKDTGMVPPDTTATVPVIEAWTVPVTATMLPDTDVEPDTIETGIVPPDITAITPDR